MNKKFDLYPTRGSFEPGMPIAFRIQNLGSATNVVLHVSSIDGLTFECSAAIEEGMPIVTISEHRFGPGGYGVKAQFCINGVTLATCFTAFDVAPAGKVIRYGFLCDFTPENGQDTDIEAMARMHINAVQFYDWSYRHDDFVSPTPDYTDMMGKHNNLTIIRKKIQQCRSHGMLTLAYGAVYAASEAYQKQHPDQSLYNGAGEPICFINTFYIMNLEREAGWHNHILEQYQHAINDVGFDGIHMDTYGAPKFAFDSQGRAIYLCDEFPKLIESAHLISTESRKTPFLMFNNVGGWPASRTMLTSQQAVYIEVWPPCTRYRHLGALISEARNSRKPVVLAAYPAPFRTDAPERALECQLFLSFVIGMYGATQLFFGEENAVITQGYYVDYTKLNDEQLEWIRVYQDFFVQYETLLMDDTMEDVSMTHQGWDNHEYAFSPEGSADGEDGKIWFHLRQNRKRKAIYIVNLLNNNSLWNEGKIKPCKMETVTMQVQVMSKPNDVWFASPDQVHGQRRHLPYQLLKTEQGLAVCAEVQVLRCGVIVVEGG